MMMRPHAVSQYLPLVQQVADDFVARIDQLRDPQGEVPNFRNELLKWNLECRFSGLLADLLDTEFDMS